MNTKKCADAPRDRLGATIRRGLHRRDPAGIAGEAIGALAGAGGGAAASGLLAAKAGATTLLGSKALAALFGGVLVTSTPAGWVAACAAGGALIGLAVARMARSGAAQDHVRRELARADTRRAAKPASDAAALERLARSLDEALAANVIDGNDARRIAGLAERGSLDASKAVELLTAAIAAAERGTSA